MKLQFGSSQRELPMNVKPFKRRFFTRYRKLPWTHILLAVLLVLVGVLILPTAHESAWLEIRKAIGGALLAVGLVSVLYDYLFVRRVIGGYFELLKTSAALELDKIYSHRLHALEDIAAELQKASGSVKISCISGSDFSRTVPPGDQSQASWRADTMCIFDFCF